MSMRMVMVIFGILSIFPIVGYTEEESPLEGSISRSNEGPVDYSSLLAALRAAGATVVPIDLPPPQYPDPPPACAPECKLPAPLFSPEGRPQVITINGQTVRVFEFASQEVAEWAAGGVRPDGLGIRLRDKDGRTLSIRGWSAMDSTHFYKGGTLIVYYVGRENNIIHLLTTLLGPQFAGIEQPGAPVLPPQR